jgi:hypothetical protein
MDALSGSTLIETSVQMSPVEAMYSSDVIEYASMISRVVWTQATYHDPVAQHVDAPRPPLA